MLCIIILFLLLILILTIIIICNCNKVRENFIYTNFLFNNYNLLNKKNMSRDIRGDPLIIPKMILPWNFGTINPIHNIPLSF